MPRKSKNDDDDDTPKVKLNRENLSKTLWLFSYLGRYKAMLIPAIFFVLLTSAMTMAFPILMGELIGKSMEMSGSAEVAKPEGDEAAADGMAHANRIAGTLAIILLIQAVVTFCRMQLLGRAGDLAVADVRRATYKKLVHLPMAFYSERRVGELSSRLAADLSLIRDTLCATTPQFLRQCVILIGGISFLFYLSPKLAIVMIGTLPPVLLAVAFFGFKIRGTSRDAQDQLAETNVVVDETLHGIADVKAFANEGYEIKRYDNGIDSYLKSAFKLINGRAFMVAFVIFAMMGTITFVVWFGARMLNAGDLSPTIFAKFVLVTAFLSGAFIALPEIVSQIQKAVGATDRLREILEEEPESDDATGKKPKKRAKGSIAFNDVRFAYPARPDTMVLDGVSFSAKSGERIAIVGPSGAGKSTLISLLLRFFDPLEGKIELDNKLLKDLPLDWLRGQMALVPQEVLLFGGSIQENIAYGDPKATKQEIVAAAKRANAHEFISSFPEGYDAQVGERGVKLSGGQKQRIAIARAILANPAVLILDEATSSLDSESERLVQEALDDLMKNRTSLIIAHRLSTVRDADRILVLNNGNIVQQGTHDELVEDVDGLYRMLTQLQLA